MTAVIISVLLLAGCFFILMAAFGLLRFPDVYCRAHATGMSPSWGFILVLLAALVFFTVVHRSFNPMFLVIFFCLYLTAPVGTHMILKGAYFSGAKLGDETVRDDLAEFLNQQEDKKEQQQED